jgi:hypothetical protein
MLNALDPDPQQALLKLAAAIAYLVAGIVIAVLRVRRVRRHGARPLAIVTTVVAVAALVVSLYPAAVPPDWSFFLLITAFIVLIRPEGIVASTGGPRIEWQALRAGRQLAQMVALRGNPVLARLNPEIRDRTTALHTLDGPTTAAYLDALRAALFADPEAVTTAALRATLETEELALRAGLGARPWWEHADGTMDSLEPAKPAR